MPASLRVLTPEILRQSRSEPEGFGFNGLGAAVFHRTYVRREPDGTLIEPFAENGKGDLTAVLARVVEGTYRIQREHQPASRWDEAKARRSAAEMFHHMRRMYFLPPGRGLWAMGSDFVHDRGVFEALQNCFAGDGRLYVKGRGSVRFAEVVDETVEVLTDVGWRDAVVKDFGVQPLQDVTFSPTAARRTNHRETVRVTPNHRWLLADGQETTSLKVGDVVRGHAVSSWLDGGKYDEGLRHGVIFGDGSAGYKYADGSRSYFARLCGSKARYADKFERATYPESAEGDPVVTVRSASDLEAPPEGETDYSYLRGFIEGWLATDGTSVDESGGIIGSQNPSTYDWLREYAPLAGFVVVGVNTDARETPYGKRSAPLWRVTLRTGTDWIVRNIEPLDEDRVFCAVVPGEASFTLFGGIYTGNCAFMSTRYLPTERGDAWRWMAEMLMLGVGVGFDTKGANLVRLNQPMSRAVETFVVPDTREGWGEAFEALWDSYHVPYRPTLRFDFSLVRPRGVVIAGFGGVASGPEPLAEALELGRFVLDRCVREREGLISSRVLVDFGNLIGQCVVAGNVRRSAEIALGVPGDREFLDLKNPAAFGGWEGLQKERPWSWLSNNSIVVDSRQQHEPDYADVAARIYENGEPGVVWLDAARRYGRYGEEMPDWDVEGVNPCVTADTWVQTAEGPRQVAELVGGSSVPLMVDGRPFDAVPFFPTGTHPVFRLLTREGYSLRLTANHRLLTEDGEWVEAGDLAAGDRVRLQRHPDGEWDGKGTREMGYLCGLLVGDGYVNAGQAKLLTWDTDAGVEPVRERAEAAIRAYPARSDFAGWSGPYGVGWRFMGTASFSREAASFGLIESKTVTAEVERASSDFYAGFLGGLFDADGHVEGYRDDGGLRVVLSTVSRELAEAVQRMLLRLGIYSRIYGYEHSSTWGTSPRLYRVSLGGASVLTFARRVGFTHAEKRRKVEDFAWKRGPYRERFAATVEALVPDGEEAVFDTTVEHVHAFDANGLYAHNCAEQQLGHREMCTLVETFPSRIPDLETYLRTLKYAYLYAKTVTVANAMVSDDISRAVMSRNYRIGLSTSGITQAIGRRGEGSMVRWWRTGYDAIQRYDEEYSRWLGVPRSVRTTSVKPSGTVSLVAGVTPGVHYPVSRYYVRRFDVPANSEILPLLVARGYEVEPSAQQPGVSYKVLFPVDAGRGTRSVEDVPLREQVRLAALAQSHHADNMVSFTGTFSRSNTTVADVADALRQARGSLKAVSFLPAEHGYEQAPYEPVSRERVEAMVARIQPVDFDLIGHAFDEAYCDNDTCEIPEG